MPGPKEETLRKAQFDPARDAEKDPRKTSDALASSKRAKTTTGHVEDPPRSTRARRPRSGRSGSDSGASNATKGH